MVPNTPFVSAGSLASTPNLQPTIPVTATTPAPPPALAPSGFEIAISRFKEGLFNDKERKEFTNVSTEKDVRNLIIDIQNKQATQRQMKNLGRLRNFVDSLSKYMGIISVCALGTSTVGTFIWGPLRALLKKASDHVDAFIAIMKALEQIGENFPRFEKYSRIFEYDVRIQEVISWLYGDILQFYLGVIGVLRGRAWMAFFKLRWSGFGSRLEILIANIKTRTLLIDSEAIAAEIELSQKQREEEEKRQRCAEKANQLKQIDELGQALSPILPKDDRDEILEKRCDGTGDWILQHNLVESWLRGEKTYVWMTGIPGAGKSVITSVILEAAENRMERTQRGIVLSFFCRGINLKKSSALAILQSFVYQYVMAVPESLPYVYEAVVKKKCSQGYLAKLFDQILGIGMDTPVYIVLDGLDEIPDEDISFVLKNVIRVGSSHDVRKRVFLASRRIRAVEMAKSQETRWILELNGITDKDIETYIRTKIDEVIEEHDLFVREPQLAQEMPEKLIQKADGMFLWAELVIEGLLKRKTIADLKETLDRLPSGLPEVYSQILRGMERLAERERSMGISVLCWVTFAKRPLSVMELEDLLTLRWSNNGTMDDERRPCGLRYICGPILDIVRKGRNGLNGPADMVSFVHITVKEFLLKAEYGTNRQPYLDKHTCLGYIAESAISYQSFKCFETEEALEKECGPSVHPDEILKRLVLNGDIRLLDYMQRYWLSHLEDFFVSLKQRGQLQGATVLTLFQELICRKMKGSKDPKKVDVGDKASIGTMLLPCLYSIAASQGPVLDSVASRIVRLISFYGGLLKQENTATTPAELEVWINENDPFGNWKRGVHLKDLLELLLTSRTPEYAGANSNLDILERLYGSRSYHCRYPYCERYSASSDGFGTDTERNNHEKKAHSTTYQCSRSDCLYNEKRLKSMSALKNHMKKYHLEIKGFKPATLPVEKDWNKIDIQQLQENRHVGFISKLYGPTGRRLRSESLSASGGETVVDTFSSLEPRENLYGTINTQPLKVIQEILQEKASQEASLGDNKAKVLDLAFASTLPGERLKERKVKYADTYGEDDSSPLEAPFSSHLQEEVVEAISLTGELKSGELTRVFPQYTSKSESDRRWAIVKGQHVDR
ncbi:hypothetical protein BJ508DRAFT_414641 [Ascobolus immersus RN42]|uniref:Uncharacterized protein n=1 Tax=Ascobolus immersus RN42 TaxID=1160509 RepID=A0A3N4I6N9_ASCIM|nr:hypothetical protein BJ508DRAFT_414641 [Ascobolus immersus RN42]